VWKKLALIVIRSWLFGLITTLLAFSLLAVQLWLCLRFDGKLEQNGLSSSFAVGFSV
jgi:hypothetical protein